MEVQGLFQTKPWVMGLTKHGFSRVMGFKTMFFHHFPEKTSCFILLLVDVGDTFPLYTHT